MVVYLERRGRAPKKTDRTVPLTDMPVTLTVDGITYYWRYSDQIEKHTIYSETRPVGFN